MSYQLIPNLIFFACVLGVIILILRRLPEAQNLSENDLKKDTVESKLEEKGIPAPAYNRFTAQFKFYLHKIWSLALEAKDLRPKPGSYNLKKLFQLRSAVKPSLPQATLPNKAPTSVLSENQTNNLEEKLLAVIRQEPKNKKAYDDLGKYYLAAQQYQDAKDIYAYLVGHEAGNPVFHARLAQCAFLLKDFALAEDQFEKSLALDKMHPNRYYNLGLAQECQGKWKEALESFSKALEMDVQNAKYQAALEKAKKQIE